MGMTCGGGCSCSSGKGEAFACEGTNGGGECHTICECAQRALVSAFGMLATYVFDECMISKPLTLTCESSSQK